MKNTHDFIVIGGGAIGTSIAWYLAKDDHSVLVLEKETLGSQASGGAAGMLAAQAEAEKPGAFLRSAMRSRDLYGTFSRQALEEARIDIGYRRCGILKAAWSEEEVGNLRRTQAWQESEGFPIEWWDTRQMRKHAPQLDRQVLGGLYFPEDGQVLSSRVVSAFHILAERAGARFLEHHAVSVFSHHGRRVISVEAGGEKYYANSVVLAAGAWNHLIACELGLSIEIKPIKGQLVYLDSPPDIFNFPVYAESIYFVPKPDGTFVLGATQEDVGFDTSPTREAEQDLLERGEERLPGLAQMNYKGTWAGLRPWSSDGLQIGRIPGWDNLYQASGHFRHGILLAPVSGQLFSELVLNRVGI